MAEVYDRLLQLVPRGTDVIDIGGGRGFLAERLRDERGCTVEVWDISSVAVGACIEKGIPAKVVDLITDVYEIPKDVVVVATECFEHLPEETRMLLLERAKNNKVFLSVPNDCMGPDVEPQHTVQYTAMSFKRDLLKYFKDVRIEVLGPCKAPFVGRYLLGVGGVEKSFRLSFTMPVRDEEKDIERVLCSFRAAADEIVIGIDYRSKDKTREIAEKYADLVFTIDDPLGPPDDLAPKVHFGHIRNRCMDKCTGDWIFMSEGHESLKKGTDSLLQLDRLMPKGVKVGYVWRTGQGQRWGFPWLTNGADTRLRYTRSTHNDLTIPDDAFVVKLPQVETWHFRDHATEMARKAQRKVQNRVTLFDDWLHTGSVHSLFHLASEWRDFSVERSFELFDEFLRTPNKNGDARYQARLILAKEHSVKALKARDAGDEMGFASHLADARKILLEATGDNWNRIEHWMWLGDIAAEQELFAEALQFYRYAATQIGEPPFVLFWIDEDMYGHLPAQRLSMTYCSLGQYEDALFWAQRVIELFPEGTPEEAINEAKEVVRVLEEEIHASQ